jgi:hypothetical protein
MIKNFDIFLTHPLSAGLMAPGSLCTALYLKKYLVEAIGLNAITDGPGRRSLAVLASRLGLAPAAQEGAR